MKIICLYSQCGIIIWKNIVVVETKDPFLQLFYLARAVSNEAKTSLGLWIKVKGKKHCNGETPLLDKGFLLDSHFSFWLNGGSEASSVILLGNSMSFKAGFFIIFIYLFIHSFTYLLYIASLFSRFAFCFELGKLFFPISHMKWNCLSQLLICYNFIFLLNKGMKKSLLGKRLCSKTCCLVFSVIYKSVCRRSLRNSWFYFIFFIF